jgi:hypothetical protein
MSNPVDIQFILPQSVQNILSKENYEIKSDLDYYYLIEAIAIVKLSITTVKQSLFDQMTGNSFGNDLIKVDSLSVTGSTYVNILKTFLEKLENIKFESLKTTLLKPRLILLVEKLEISEIEKDIFEFVYLYSISTHLRKSYHSISRHGGGMNFFSVSSILNCDISYVVKFFSSSSIMVKENIINSVSKPSNDITISNEGNLIALLGINLSAIQLSSIESEFIQRLIEQITSNGEHNCIDSNELLQSNSLADITVNTEEYSDMQSLYSILKQEEKDVVLNKATTSDEMKIEENQSNDINSSLNLNETSNSTIDLSITEEIKEKIDDVKEITAYTNDLNYCQDQILLSRLVSKISKESLDIELVSDMDEMEDNGNGGYGLMYDQNTGMPISKEQQIQKKEISLRKLRNKEKIMKLKINQRLTLTKAKGIYK